MLPWRRTDAPRLGRGFGPLWAANAFGSMVVLTTVAWRLFTREALDAERQQVARERTDVPA